MAEFNASQLGLKRLPKEVEQAFTATGWVGTQKSNTGSDITSQEISSSYGPTLSQDENLLKQKIEQAGGSDEQFYEALRQYRNEKGIAVWQRDTEGNIITRLGETIKLDSNEDDGLFESIGKFGVNIFGDSVQLVGELVDIVSHPIEFAKNTYDLGYGVSDALLNKVWLDLPGEDRAEMARIIGNQIKENFTDIDKFKKMIVENPVDTILTLVPGVNAAKWAATASKLTKTAKALEIIEKTMMAPIRAELSVAKWAVKAPWQIGSKVFEFGVSQGTGMNVDTLKTLIKNPKIIDDVKGGVVSRDSLADELFKGIEKLEWEMLSSLWEYKSTRSFPASVKLGTTVQDFLKDSGITISDTGKIVDDSFKFTKSEFGKLQELVDKVQTVAGSKWGYIGIDDFLDLRQYVNKSLAKFDTWADSDKLKNLGKSLYTKLNKEFRPKIPGLDELDSKFMNQIDFLNTVKKDYFLKSGKPKDNFMSLLETITNKGKEMKLDRLREIIPDIEAKSNSLKAVADIDAAMGSKVGTYTRGWLFVGGMFTWNPILAISQLILLNPAIASKVLQWVGYSREFINRIIDKVKTGKKLEKEEIVAIKEASQSVMADDVKKIWSDGPDGDDIGAFVKEFETEIDNLIGNKEGLAEAKEAILDYDIPQENKAYLLQKVNQHLDDIDGYEFEVNLGMGGFDTLRETFWGDLVTAFNVLEGIKKRTKSTAGGDKMTSIEFEDSPAYKNYSTQAQSWLKENDPDGTMSVQDLYQKMDDINFAESQRSTPDAPAPRSIDSDLWEKPKPVDKNIAYSNDIEKEHFIIDATIKWSENDMLKIWSDVSVSQWDKITKWTVVKVNRDMWWAISDGDRQVLHLLQDDWSIQRVQLKKWDIIDSIDSMDPTNWEGFDTAGNSLGIVDDKTSEKNIVADDWNLENNNIERNRKISESYKESAKERFKKNDFTQTEILKWREKLESLYMWREIEFDWKKWEIVSKPYFWKIKIKIWDKIMEFETSLVKETQKKPSNEDVIKYLKWTEYDWFDLKETWE